MKQPMRFLLFWLCLTIFSAANTAKIESHQTNQETAVYKLAPQFYQKAEEWVRIREKIPDDQLLRITIRGYLLSLGLGAEVLGKATFQIDPRKNTHEGPLLYIQAPKDLIKKMKARHFQLTGSQAKLLKLNDLKIIAKLRAEQEKRNALKPDPFSIK